MKVYNEIEQAFSDGHDSRDEEVEDLEIEVKQLKKKNLKMKNLIVSFSNCMKDDSIYVGEYVGLIEKSKELIDFCSL